MSGAMVRVDVYPKGSHCCRHPVTQALRAVEHAHEHDMEAWRVVDEQLSVDAEVRYAAVLLAPQRIMRKQVVVLIDWTRCGRVKSLALPIYVSSLRRAQAQIRRSNEFYFLLHYPARHLDTLAFDAAMAMAGRHFGEMTQERSMFWREVLERRLVQGQDVATIANDMGLRGTEIRSLLREAAFMFRKGRVMPNPLDPFRFGGARWGGFKLDWDEDAQGYTVAAEERPSNEVCQNVAELLGEIRWQSQTAHFDLRPNFDLALPSQQGDGWGGDAGADDGISMAELFPDAGLDW